MLASLSSPRAASSRLPVATKTEQPILLLPGDEFFVSPEGVARTYYQLRDGSVGLEESYDLGNARKSFQLRTNQDLTSSSCVLSSQTQGLAPLGVPILQDKVEIQEIDEGPIGAAGTGAMTWEASIAMALWCAEQNLAGRNAMNSQQRVTKVVELGCGVGLGGILTSLVSSNGDSTHLQWTMTDGNRHVLRQCHDNLVQVQRAHASLPLEQVQRVVWGEPLPPHLQGAFDAVVACDCAYLPKDIDALAQTMTELVEPDSGVVHLFAPRNRAAFEDLMVCLRVEHGMNLQVHELELVRYRLKPEPASKWSHVEASSYASQASELFWHVVANRHNEPPASPPSFDDID